MRPEIRRAQLPWCTFAAWDVGDGRAKRAVWLRKKYRLAAQNLWFWKMKDERLKIKIERLKNWFLQFYHMGQDISIMGG